MLERARAIQERLSELRRAVHRYPELGFQETRTAALVADYLRDLGLEVLTGVAKTGAIGYLGTGRPVVMLRADMDALQIQEQNEVPYASEQPGLMHACGHDNHVACLLGAATLLVQDPPPHGQVRFLFQPSEEGADAEGKHGARRVMEEGYVDDLDAVFGLHVTGDVPAGQITVSPGLVSSAADRFRGAVLGQACHGARPETGIDAIVLAANVVNAIHQIVSRRISGLDSGVITIGTINGGTRQNIVAGRVDLVGSMRSYRPETREKLIVELERAFRVAEVLGGSYELHVDRGPASVVNDEGLAGLVRQVGEELLGQQNVLKGQPMMGSEDFSFLTQRTPGCFFWLGGGFPGQPARVLHSPTFDVDESALPVGAAMLASTARRFLAEAR